MFMTDKDGYPASCFNSPEEGRPPKVKYPFVDVQLVGVDGNAFMVLGTVRRAMTKAMVPVSEIENFTTEAMAGNYDHLLQTCMRWVNVS